VDFINFIIPNGGKERARPVDKDAGIKFFRHTKPILNQIEK
jgi:hypothetical protein